MFKPNIIERIRKLADGSDANPKNDMQDPRIKRISGILDEIEKYSSEDEIQESDNLKTTPGLAELPGRPDKRSRRAAEAGGTCEAVSSIKADISEIKEKLSENVKLDAFLEDTNAIKSALLRTVKDIEAIQTENSELKDKIKKLESAKGGQIDIEARQSIPADKEIRGIPGKKEYSTLKKSLDTIEKSITSLKKDVDADRTKIGAISSRIDSGSARQDAIWHKVESMDLAEFKSELNGMKSALEELKFAGGAPAQQIKINDLPEINAKKWRFDVRKHLPENKVDLEDLMKRLEDVKKRTDNENAN